MTDESKSAVTEPETEPSVTESASSTDATTSAGEETPAKLNQSVEIKDVGPCKKHVQVTIPREDIDSRLDKKYSELVFDAPVSGFRPGKAPRKVIERRFRKDVTDQVKGELLLESLEQLDRDHDLSPLSPPDLNPTKIEIPEKGPFVYEFNVEVRPKFDLPNYKGLKLKRPVQTFTDEDVMREEHKLLAPYGQLVPKATPAGGGEPHTEIGDYLIVDITMMVGNKDVSNLKEVTVRVDNQLAFKDGVAENFGEKLKGGKAGETRTVDVVLSDAVADPALRGQKLQARFDIKDLKTIRLPELTHELCHEFGVHSAEQLRELLRVVLQRRLEYNQRQSARQQVLQQIATASDWELPQDLLMRQARRTLYSRIMEMRSSGISEDEIKTRQRLMEQDVLRSTAVALKEQFVMQKIADLEKLDISDDDINDEIERVAAQTDESPRRVRARLEKDDLLEALASEILERKALDLVLQHAEYEDVPVGATTEPDVATIEHQAVQGEMKDPTIAPPAAEEPPAAPSS